MRCHRLPAQIIDQQGPAIHGAVRWRTKSVGQPQHHAGDLAAVVRRQHKIFRDFVGHCVRMSRTRHPRFIDHTGEWRTVDMRRGQVNKTPHPSSLCRLEQTQRPYAVNFERTLHVSRRVDFVHCCQMHDRVHTGANRLQGRGRAPIHLHHLRARQPDGGRCVRLPRAQSNRCAARCERLRHPPADVAVGAGD